MANEQKTYDIFISYSRKDTEQVLEIANKLSGEGYNIWIDRDGIESGDAFKAVIVKAIKNSKIFMFFSSKSANTSPWTVKEVNMAVYLKKTIIPVKLDDSDYDDSIMFDLVGVDYVEYKNDSTLQCIEDILRAIKKHIGQPAIEIKKLKEEIKKLEKEGQRLYGEERRVWDGIVIKKRQLGDVSRICPVCGIINDVDSQYCHNCGWTYIPFQLEKLDEKRLVVAKRIWDSRGSLDTSNQESSDQSLPQPIIELMHDMVRIEGGVFTMGGTREQGEEAFDDEKPSHKVAVSSFYMAKYPITQEQWEAVMGSNPSHFKGEKLPVDSVSWYDCLEFIKKLSEVTGKHFRLPTEAEWEFAARGGKKGKRYKYSGGNILNQVGWYNENSNGTSHQVGLKSPNELGLYDMSGNIWEWVQDWKGEYTECEQENPTGPEVGMEKVCRGGGWNREIDRARVSYRGDDQPDFRYCSLGLRVALEE
jgi:formylglycine-generating enzyme required for sulfatase activity